MCTSRPVSRVLSGDPLCSKPPRRPFIWDVCYQTPQAINPGGGPEDGLDIVRFLPHVRPPLFDLAPGGVCPATSVTRRAVRSYRTFSPLLAFPLRVRRSSPLRACHAEAAYAAKAGGLFSVALSLGSPPAAVSRHRSFKEPGLSSTGFALASATFRVRLRYVYPAAAVRPAGG